MGRRLLHWPVIAVAILGTVAANGVAASSIWSGRPCLGTIWPAGATLVVCFAILCGRSVEFGPLSILFDERGRCSLTRLQVLSWTTVVFSLIASVALLRVLAGAPDALGFEIADELLIVLGISLGSGVVAAAVKSAQDATFSAQIAAGIPDDEREPSSPKWRQLVLVEAGAGADQVVDVAKFQNLLITIVVVASYCAYVLRSLGSETIVVALPGFSETVLLLVGISHAGYLAGKLAPPVGVPRASVRTLAQRNGARTRRGSDGGQDE